MTDHHGIIQNPLTTGDIHADISDADGLTDIPLGETTVELPPDTISDLVRAVKRVEGLLLVMMASIIFSITGAIAKYLEEIPSGTVQDYKLELKCICSNISGVKSLPN